MMTALNRVSSLLFMSCVIMGLVSCTNMKSENSGEKELKQRVEQEWNAKIQGDWGTVYDLATEAFQKKVDKQAFVSGAKIHVIEFALKDLKIQESDKAIAVVQYKVLEKGYEFNFTSKEEWFLEKGSWHLNLLPILGTPMSPKKS